MLNQALLLLKSREQKEDLRLKGRARRIGVELADEGVSLNLLLDQSGIEPTGQRARERGFADPYRALHGDQPRMLRFFFAMRCAEGREDWFGGQDTSPGPDPETKPG